MWISREGTNDAESKSCRAAFLEAHSAFSVNHLAKGSSQQPSSTTARVVEKRRGDTDPDEPRGSPAVLNAFKILPILGLPHITVRIALRCVLHRFSSQGIHRCN